ncbi:hypothetical protein F2Q69_00043280 [Brassica cretica]|uniref:PPC domain-containing protein n=1 Tax=Brassica cretica TaxID=69181 RepID=A0A8S9NP80_BRACR|nr:hypothetical protein F2Q69_00043280 [Brassica cretica]
MKGRERKRKIRSHVLEVSYGADIVESVNTYARRRGRGVSVLSGNGTVANVALRQPVTIHGNNCGTREVSRSETLVLSWY